MPGVLRFMGSQRVGSNSNRTDQSASSAHVETKRKKSRENFERIFLTMRTLRIYSVNSFLIHQYKSMLCFCAMSANNEKHT